MNKHLKFRYKIVHPYTERINPQRDFIDIEVKIVGKSYRGSVTTTRFIDNRLKDYQQTRENKSGSYFCAKGMIILRRIDKKTIKRTLQDLVERGDVKEFLTS